MCFFYLSSAEVVVFIEDWGGGYHAKSTRWQCDTHVIDIIWRMYHLQTIFDGWTTLTMEWRDPF